MIKNKSLKHLSLQVNTPKIFKISMKKQFFPVLIEKDGLINQPVSRGVHVLF